ncbi:MAG: hypothetical protein IKQ41_07205 [Clostridia bacterium]|nr:hypothetical protein [Clostridia bacterium]
MFVQRPLLLTFPNLSRLINGGLRVFLMQGSRVRRLAVKVFGKESIPTIAYTEEEFKKIETCLLPHLNGSDLLYVGFTIYI